MGTFSTYTNGVLTFRDKSTFETVAPLAPNVFYTDFVGAGNVALPAAGSAENGVFWTKKIVGAAPPTVAGVANAANGVIACTLTSASQKQDAAFYFDDQLNFDITKGVIFETRVALAVLPSVAAVQAVFGLSSAWIDGPDNASAYLQFGATGSGAILLRSQDGATQKSISSGTTKTAGSFSIYRIDATDVTDVKYFIDGNQVSANNAVPFAATGASAILQPYFAMYKASGTGVGTLHVDYVRVWSGR